MAIPLKGGNGLPLVEITSIEVNFGYCAMRRSKDYAFMVTNSVGCI